MTAAAIETVVPPEQDAARLADEVHHIKLAFSGEELTRLRFAILLTARWQASDAEEPERRKELLTELAELRRLYNDKIDEIAMAFGVAQAMQAKAEVERTVVLPLEPRRAQPARVDGGLHF